MGMFSGIKRSWDDFRGATGARAAREAGRIQSEAQTGVAATYQPLIDMGMQNLEGVQQGSTGQGYMQGIGDIMNGGGAFGQMVQERGQAADNYMSNKGLRRSGTAVQAAANIPTDVAMMLEGEMDRRRRANLDIGQNAMAGQNAAMLGAAGADASGLLGAAQSRSQGIGNILGMVGSVGGALATGGMSLAMPSLFGGGGGVAGSRPGDYSNANMSNWQR